MSILVNLLLFLLVRFYKYLYKVVIDELLNKTVSDIAYVKMYNNIP